MKPSRYAPRVIGGARTFISQAIPLFLEFHVNPAASESDINAPCGGGKKNLHTVLICHSHGISPANKRHPSTARVIVTVEILQLLQVVNFARSGTTGNPDFAQRKSVY